MGVTTGSFSGLVTIKDAGSSLPGVLITAVHEPTGTRYTSVTREDGRYRIVNVRVGGPYTMTAEMTGFDTETKEDLFVKLGEDLVVNFQLQVATVEE